MLTIDTAWQSLDADSLSVVDGNSYELIVDVFIFTRDVNDLILLYSAFNLDFTVNIYTAHYNYLILVIIFIIFFGGLTLIL